MSIEIPKRIRSMAPPEVTEWGFRVVARDRTTRNGYRWAAPGEWAEAPGPVDETNTGACPGGVGDGICAARSWAGVHVRGYRWDRVMLVGWSPADVLGDETDNVRLRRAWVGGMLTIGSAAHVGANLYGADLSGADLCGANLYGADLSGAYLCGADLSGADLSGAYLRGAYLSGAYLCGAYLYGADLCGANLSGADLSGAWRFETDPEVPGWKLVEGRLRRAES